jgi:hypothetical protein
LLRHRPTEAMPYTCTRHEAAPSQPPALRTKARRAPPRWMYRPGHVHPFQQIHIEVCGPGRCLPALLSGVTPPPRYHMYYNTPLFTAAATMPLGRLRTHRASGCLWQNQPTSSKKKKGGGGEEGKKRGKKKRKKDVSMCESAEPSTLISKHRQRKKNACGRVGHPLQ